MERLQKQYILDDLKKKMVLLVGPRQAGKTWLSQDIAKEFAHPTYLNYDFIPDKNIIKNYGWLNNTDLLILDELHKMPEWKNYLKGLYDTKPESLKVLVTGSARLQIYDKIGDSLAGRYFRHRLLPLSPAELAQTHTDPDINRLIEYGNFPEPYQASEKIDAERWRLQYINSLLSTDIFEIETIKNLKAMQLVFDMLRHRVGAPISYQSIAEDVAISPITVKKYIDILEALYIVFRITPYSKNIARSLLKEPKIYFYDTALIEDRPGARLENLVAVSLLKHTYARTDYKAENCTLHYLRTKEGKEVDFAIVKDNEIEQIIEVKTTDPKPTKALQYFHTKYDHPAIQLVQSLHQNHTINNIQVLTVQDFLQNLYM